MLLRDQKSLSGMKTLIANYSPCGDFAYDPLAGPYATFCALMLLPVHRCSTLGHMDGDCPNYSIMQLVLVFTVKLWTPNSTLLEHRSWGILQDYCFNLGMKLMKRRTVKVGWQAPTGCPPLKLCPQQVVHFLFSIHIGNRLYRNGLQLPIKGWCSTWCVYFIERE